MQYHRIKRIKLSTNLVAVRERKNEMDTRGRM